MIKELAEMIKDLSEIPVQKQTNLEKTIETEKALGINTNSAIQTEVVEQTVSLQQVQTKIAVIPTVKQLSMNTDDMGGKILMLAKEGFFKGWHPLRDTVKALEEHKWTAPSSAVKSALISLESKQILAVKIVNGEKQYSLRQYVEFV